MEAGLSLDGIDWTAPWLADWRDPGERIASRIVQGLSMHEALNEAAGAPVRFVPHSAMPSGEAYERYIFESGNCPTREGLHDFFNALVWRGMPLSKRRLNALQAAQIQSRGIASVRGPVRDAITVFDENGALLDAAPPLWDALLAREWQRAFVELRPLWQQARLFVFGHALLEKLVTPRKDMTAHVWRGPAPLSRMQAADEWLAAQFTEDRLASKPFTPLPVLGVPGWWQANQNFSFYDDSLVFRQARRRA